MPSRCVDPSGHLYRNVRLPISGCDSMVAYRFSLHATPLLAATAAVLSSRGPRYMVQAVNSREGWLHLGGVR